MTISEQHILSLVRSSLTAEPLTDAYVEQLGQLDAEGWRQIVETAKRNGCGAIIYDVLQQWHVAMPRREKMHFIYLLSSIEQKYNKQVSVLCRLCDFYAAHGIRTMVLKGIGVSLMYPTPSHRQCGDIDIWLFGQQECADRLLAQEKNIAVDLSHHHHTVFTIGGIMVENHYDFLNYHARRSTARMERAMRAEARSGEIAQTVGGHRIYIPSPNLNALFLSYHAGAHFAAAEIGLRHLLDWCVFVRHYGREVDWPHIKDIARNVGYEQFLDCLNCLAVEWGGVSEECVAPYSCSAELKAAVMDDIVGATSLNVTIDKRMPKNFFAQWTFRLRRRLRNRWKQRLVYPDNAVVAFLTAALTHIIPVRYWNRLHKIS